MNEIETKPNFSFMQIFKQGLLHCLRCGVIITFENQGFNFVNERPRFFVACCKSCETNHGAEIEQLIRWKLVAVANALNMRIEWD